MDVWFVLLCMLACFGVCCWFSLVGCGLVMFGVFAVIYFDGLRSLLMSVAGVGWTFMFTVLISRWVRSTLFVYCAWLVVFDLCLVFVL